MNWLLIGIDDTDIPGVGGTGRLTRDLAAHLESRGAGTVNGVTRHQLLEHPDIPFTSHNSAACIALNSSQDLATVRDLCTGFLKASAVTGSDPGLAMAEPSLLPGEAVEFGRMAQVRVLGLDDAEGLARDTGILAESTGKPGQGIIGALAAVGLRGSGNDGRFIALRGIREVSGVLRVGNIKETTDVVSVRTGAGTELNDDSLVDTLSWLRPRLIDGQAILVVRPHGLRRGRWISVDARDRRGPKS